VTEAIRVLLADDHAVVRKGTREFLEEAGDIAVIAEAADGAAALRLVETYRPDVAILDVELPEMSGVELTRAIKARYPTVRVLILTVYDDDPHIFALLQAGADSYLLKNTGIDELIRAVRITAAGGKALDPSIRQRSWCPANRVPLASKWNRLVSASWRSSAWPRMVSPTKALEVAWASVTVQCRGTWPTSMPSYRSVRGPRP
jgi:CheY-like chemotaxis protein